MLKKSIILLLLVTTMLFSKDSLTIYTYNSFTSKWGPGPSIKKAFEEKYNCEVKLVGLGDGSSILNRLRLEGDKTKADIILGLDTNMIQSAIDTKLIAKHKTDTSKLTLPIKWRDEYFIPFDYGYYAFIYNSEKTKTPPKSFEEFLNNKNSLIYQDPRTSTVGFGLLLWIEKLYKDKSSQVWKDIKQKTITVTKGWSEAYNMFLKGESDYVLSYTTSPAYHQIAEKKNQYKAAIFKEGHYMQVEVLAKTTTSKNPLADKFLEFALSKDFQQYIPTGNWMYPVIDIDLPKEFQNLPKPKIALEFDKQTVFQNRKKWLNTWKNSLID